MTVASILRSKGDKLVTIRPSATITVALKRLRLDNIGSLVVTDEAGRLQGILSERDIVLSLASRGPEILDRPVADIMSRSVRTCRPDDSIAALMAIMTRSRIRHVPVMSDGELVGMVSIGDVVKARLEEVEYERDVMRDVSLAH